MKRLLLPLLITLMLTPVLAAAQPQADSLRHLLRTQPHNPHLLAQMAQAFSTSCPDSALHYAQLATQHKAQGADVVTLEAARGEALAAQGHIQQALGHFTQAYKVAQKHHLADQQHNQLCSMGICHSRLQQFDQAAKCYDQVIAYATRHHNHQLAFAAYQNYGAMCSRIGRPDDCRTLLLNALKYERAAEPAQRISVYAGLGTILTYNPATFAQAEQYLQRGINLARQAHEPLAEASCLSPLITLLTQQPNRHTEIPALIARANTIVSGLAPGGTERMQLEHAKVNYYFVTRQWAPALQSALMLYHNGPAVSSERDKVMLMVARAYEGTDQAPRACYFYREAYYIADSLHQLNIQQQVADAAARYDAKEKQLKIAQLQKDAAQAEARQWRLGASLAVATLLLIITIAGAIMRHRHQQRKAELEQARRYIDGIETERKRLAQELHDGVCNDLLVAEMQITNTASTAQATQQLNAVRQNIRHISHQLMPPNTAFATLDQTLSALACKLHEMGHIAITFSATPAHHNWAALPAAQAHQLYRIAQELITNLIKHTPQLTHISITLTHSPAAPHTTLTIAHTAATPPTAPSPTPSPSPSGAVQSPTSATPGIGLRSISERVKAISATITHTTGPQGQHITTISC